MSGPTFSLFQSSITTVTGHVVAGSSLSSSTHPCDDDDAV
jgi:hypothetical protein